MGDVIFVPDPAGYAYLTTSPNGPVGKDLAKRGEKIRALAVRQVGKNTGRLASSIRVQMSLDAQGLNVRIGSSHRLALLHHNGSRPHLIRAKGLGVMRFTSRGRVVYARVVLHPGTRPNRYLTDNLRKVMND